MAKRPPHPDQLVFDFDAPPLAIVPSSAGPVPGAAVDLRDDGSTISITVAGASIGVVDPRQYRTLSGMLGRVDVEIEANLGAIDDDGIEVIVVRRSDAGEHRNVVRGLTIKKFSFSAPPIAVPRC